MSDYPKVSETIFDAPKTNTEMFLEMVKQHFPSAIKDGEVDFDALKEEMGEFAEIGAEHYDFTWAGKQAAKKEAMSDILGRTLKFKPEDSLNADTTENIYIEGDNLEALKLLRRNYYGKIKMIYIDPPYNTGNDFIYKDDFTMSEKELSELSGATVDGERMQKNSKDSAKYHTNWLNMIYPRLRVAKDLLTNDGVIFISIGQAENHNLIKLCDDIFLENNRVGIISRIMKSGGNKGQFFSPNMEYILVYAKNIDSLGYFRESISDELSKNYNHADDFGIRAGEKYTIKGLCQPGLGIRPNQRYWIEAPDGSFLIPKGKNFPNKIADGSKILPTDEDTCWKWTYDRYIAEKENGNILFQKNTSATALVDETGEIAKWNVFNKIWLSDRQEEGRVPVDLILKWENRISSQELKDLNLTFDFAKPTKLIEYLISIVENTNNNIILDFFSGSATTAHAVMQLNAEDGGNRKYIMVQLPEPCDNDEFKNICEIGKERIRRAAKKIHEDKPDAVFDDGFKVFTVDNTNIRWTHDAMIRKDVTDYDYTKGIKDDLDFMPGYKDIDVVYEIMLRQYGIPLSTPIEKLNEVSDRTYIFADSVVVCLDENITSEIVEKLASLDPTPGKFIFRDSAFEDDIELKDVTFRRLSALVQNHFTEDQRKKSTTNYTVEFI